MSFLSGLASQIGSAARASEPVFMPREAPTKEGYLTKRSEWLLDWRRRYFKLVRNQLFFMRAPGGEPHGLIELRRCLTVKSAEDKTGKLYAFEVATPEQVFYLHADSEVEKDDWIGKIGKAIVDNSRSQIRDSALADEDDEGESEDDGGEEEDGEKR